MKSLILAAVMAFSATANAHWFTSLAKKVEGEYVYNKTIMVLNFDEEDEAGWEEAQVSDKMTIEKLSRRKIQFEIDTWYTNGHSCGIAGVAKKTSKNVFTYKGEKNFDGETCILKLIKDKKGVEIRDLNGACKWNYCGMRGYLDGMRFDFTDRI